MTIQINLKLLRTLLGSKDMSYVELADKSQLSRQTIYNIRRGRAFDIDTLGKIASALQVEPTLLISQGDVAVQLQPEVQP